MKEDKKPDTTTEVYSSKHKHFQFPGKNQCKTQQSFLLTTSEKFENLVEYLNSACKFMTRIQDTYFDLIVPKE
jgi:hypothetical protein